MSEVEFRELGMAILHRRDGTSQTDVRRFRANFGISSLVFSIVWSLLKKLRKKHPGAEMQHLCWACMMLKTYPTENDMSSKIGGVDEKTLRKWVWIFIKGIAALENTVVSYFSPNLNARIR